MPGTADYFWTREKQIIMQSRIEDTVSVLSSPCLDLSRKDISDLPEEITRCEHLEVQIPTFLMLINMSVYFQCLYLEGNRLTSLSASLFSFCPNLHWLDLRNNLLTHLPPSIHILRCAEYLLLLLRKKLAAEWDMYMLTVGESSINFLAIVTTCSS